MRRSTDIASLPAAGAAGEKVGKLMAVSPARNFAYDILIRVERDGSYASELLNAPRMDTLSREDRALTYELVMSTLRWQSELDARIAQYSSQKVSRLDGEVRVALRLGACQLNHLERIPGARRSSRKRGAGEEFGKALCRALCKCGAAQACGKCEDSGDGRRPTSADCGRCGARRTGSGVRASGVDGCALDRHVWI